MADHRNLVLPRAVADQFGGDGLAAADGEALVVGRGAGAIGVAVDLDPRDLRARGRDGCFGGDLAYAVVRSVRS